MAKRRKHKLTEYEKLLRQFHKQSSRHVLVLEADMLYQDKCMVAHMADLDRKAGNELTDIMKTAYEQLIRTKKYRKLQSLYGAYKQKEDEKRYKLIAGQMAQMQEQYHVTWDYCRTSMISIGKKYKLDAIFALTKAEDVWRAVETCLYSDGKALHFAKRGDLPVIRAKQINRGIIIGSKDDHLKITFNGITFGVKVRDRFETEEVNAILQYLKQPEAADRHAVKTMQEQSLCISTYRPCYVSLVCKTIRGKLRVYVHITIEGTALPKYDKLGNKKHTLGKGIIGCDIGTQTIAYTSDKEVGLKNLAERGSAIITNERKERRLNRAMDRSKRATNPEYYNDDGTIKKGKKNWKYSNRYRKLKARHQEFCRINAINRHLAIQEDVNHLRSLGDIFVTEPKNAKKLQKRAQKTTVDKNGKLNRKKRFGKSIQNRCPGYFQAQIEQKFTQTGGQYIEVPKQYRASQYDHPSGTFIRKKLSDRMYRLSDGTLVQRDWYSSFLLYCIDFEQLAIDRSKCIKSFQQQYTKEKALIEWIRANQIRVCNSGIRIATA